MSQKEILIRFKEAAQVSAVTTSFTMVPALIGAILIGNSINTSLNVGIAGIVTGTALAFLGAPCPKSLDDSLPTKKDGFLLIFAALLIFPLFNSLPLLLINLLTSPTPVTLFIQQFINHIVGNVVVTPMLKLGRTLWDRANSPTVQPEAQPASSLVNSL